MLAFYLQDEKLLKTTMLTERVKLWDKYNDRVNQHTVKMRFLKKIHRKDPPFRLKFRHPRRKAAQVPPFYDVYLSIQ
jgi:hypothetical protein